MFTVAHVDPLLFLSGFKKAPTTLDEKIEKVRKKRKIDVRPCVIWYFNSHWYFNSVFQMYKIMPVCVGETSERQ